MRYLPAAALLLALTLMPACKTTQADCGSKECPAVTNPYRHVVAFKFKESATDAQINQIVVDFKALQDKIDVITDFEHGKQVSPEGFDQGYTHVFIVTFKDKAGLDVYLPHPDHKAFVENLLPLLDPPPFVVDYVAK